MQGCHAVIVVNFILLMIVTPLPLLMPENSHCAGVVDASHASDEAILVIIDGLQTIFKTAEVATTPAYATIGQEMLASNTLNLLQLQLGPALSQLWEHLRVQLLL